MESHLALAICLFIVSLIDNPVHKSSDWPRVGAIWEERQAKKKLRIHIQQKLRISPREQDCAIKPEQTLQRGVEEGGGVSLGS